MQMLTAVRMVPLRVWNCSLKQERMQFQTRGMNRTTWAELARKRAGDTGPGERTKANDYHFSNRKDHFRRLLADVSSSSVPANGDCFSQLAGAARTLWICGASVSSRICGARGDFSIHSDLARRSHSSCWSSGHLAAREI